MSWKTHVAIICVVSGLVLFTNLGGPRLWDRDEPRNAGCAEEMLERGDWVTPVFNGELRTHKPVLLYWLMMSAYSVLGVNEFAARFWSAVLGVGSCVCMYFVGRRLFNAQTGLWAATILTTTLMFDVAGRAATPDSVLIFLTALALAWYVKHAFSNGGELTSAFPTDWRFLLGLYGVMGVATLAKGPVGVVLPSAVIGVFLLIYRWREHYGSPRGLARVSRPITYFISTCYAMRVHWGAVIVLVVAAPWYIWVGQRSGGAWLEGFFLEHNMGRAMYAMEGHSGSPIWFYPVALMIGFAPWSVFFAPTALDAWRRFRSGESQTAGLGFAACWVCVYVGLFSFASTKLPSYITPCYPGVALLVAAYVDRLANRETALGGLWPRLAFGIWILVGVAVMIGLPIAAQQYLPGQQWLGAIGVIPVVAGAIAMICLKIERPDAAVRAFAMGAFLFVWISFSFVSVKVDSRKTFVNLIESLEERTENPKFAHYLVLEPSWVFYTKAPIRPIYIGESKYAAKRHFGVQSGQVWVKHWQHASHDFLGGPEDQYVLTTRKLYEKIRHHLPEGAGVVAETKYFLKDESIVAIGRLAPRVATKPDRETR